MNPKIWGPHGWFFIHSIALNYPNNPTFKQKQDYFNFFKSLMNVIPCEKCAFHYSQNFKNYPIDNFLDNTEKLFNWTVDIHNMVNEKNNKRILSYEEAYKEHMEEYDNNSNGYNKDDYSLLEEEKKIFEENIKYEYENKNKVNSTFYNIIIMILVIIIIILYNYKKIKLF
tara:strand:+ start:7062 stop:7571 length:510 start_codon:yes stop_codon:yes gene_type:complete